MSAARNGMTVAELRAVLAIYDGRLPARFVSGESGGRWPQGSREPMAVFIDEQIGAVHEGWSGDKPTPSTHVEISLMGFK